MEWVLKSTREGTKIYISLHATAAFCRWDSIAWNGWEREAQKDEANFWVLPTFESLIAWEKVFKKKDDDDDYDALAQQIY